MKPPPVEREARLALAEGRPTVVGVVADTHSEPHPQLTRHLAALRPDAILHAGDIGDLSVLEALSAVAPVHAVRGNVDPRDAGLPDVLLLDLQGPAGALRLLLTHIALYGPRLRSDVARRARESGASLVVCGHSHVPFVGRQGGVTVFNPGAAGPRRFGLPIVFGKMEISERGVALAHVDCETGRRWRPA